MASHDGNSGRASGSAAAESTSTSLLSRVRARDPEAWGRLVEIYGPLVYRWCRQTALQPEDAADVAQEVFAAVSGNVLKFRRDRPGDSFRGWLWTITRGKIHDHFRRSPVRAAGGTDAQQRLAQVPEDPPETSSTGVGPVADNSPERRAVELVRAGVEPRTWQAFWQVAVEGRTAADVADELGMTVQAVYDAKYRLRRRIRQELSDLLG